MRLSEAIRIGAMVHEQMYHDFFSWGRVNEEIVIHKTCALGAARVGMGKTENLAEHVISGKVLTTLEMHFPVMDKFIRICPQIGCHGWEDGRSRQLMDIIVCLNDVHRWTREKIADWVEGIEDEIKLEEVNQELSTTEPVFELV